MFEVERQIAEKELGRVALMMLEGLHGTDYLHPIIGNEAVCALQAIRNTLDNEHLSDFECIEEIVAILWNMGIATNRHDFG